MTARRTRGLRLIEVACRAASTVALTAAVVLAVAVGMASSSAATPAGGQAQVVTPQDGSATGGQPMSEGSATAAFSLKLPARSACAGDSTDSGYRVQSFMIPDGVDPSRLTFGALGPLPKDLGADFRQPLYEVTTRAYANAATNLADAPGGPGTIINIPAFSLGVFSGTDLPPGRYTVGLACTKGGPSEPGQLDRYWTAPLVVSASQSDGSPSWTTPLAAGAPPAASEVEAMVADGAAPPDDAVARPPASTPEVVPAGDDLSASGEVAVTPPTPRSGGQPSFNLPAAELASHLSIAGSATRSLIVWSALALLSARVAYLLARAPALVPRAAR